MPEPPRSAAPGTTPSATVPAASARAAAGPLGGSEGPDRRAARRRARRRLRLVPARQRRADAASAAPRRRHDRGGRALGAESTGGPARRRRPTPADCVMVHVAGAVAQPGRRAGPAGRPRDRRGRGRGRRAPDADLDRLNLAAKVADGQRIAVAHRRRAGHRPRSADGGAVRARATERRSTTGPINLNTATSTELEELPGHRSDASPRRSSPSGSGAAASAASASSRTSAGSARRATRTSRTWSRCERPPARSRALGGVVVGILAGEAHGAATPPIPSLVAAAALLLVALALRDGAAARARRSRRGLLPPRHAVMQRALDGLERSPLGAAGRRSARPSTRRRRSSTTRPDRASRSEVLGPGRPRSTVATRATRTVLLVGTGELDSPPAGARGRRPGRACAGRSSR